MPSSPNVITPQTDIVLREVAGKYIATVAIPSFLPEVDGFASTYLGEPGKDLKTLITGSEDELEVSIAGLGDDETKKLVNIDLDVPEGGPSSIVAPGLYNKDGQLDEIEGEFAQPVVRPLTEAEGRELIMDLHAMMARIPTRRQ